MTDRKILFVGMAASSHLTAWIDLLRHSPWRVFVLGVDEASVCADLENWRWIRSANDAEALPAGTIGVLRNDHLLRSARSQWLKMDTFGAGEDHLYLGQTRLEELIVAVQWVRPTLIHALEMQRAGYLCLAGKRALGPAFPTWGIYNWGSDTYLYLREPEHRALLTELLTRCDFYACECARDVALVGAEKPHLLMPASAGYPADELPAEVELSPPSSRRLILIKGYTNFSGRGISALAVVQLAKDHLAGFEIRVRFAKPPLVEAIQRIARITGLDIAPEPTLPSRKQAMARMAQARVALSLGISDGIAATSLEAMALGAFPVQTSTSCIDEWVRDGSSGFVVPPHDTAFIAKALVKAVEDDALVDQAAVLNRRTIEERWDHAANSPRALAFYDLLWEKVAAEAAKRLRESVGITDFQHSMA